MESPRSPTGVPLTSTFSIVAYNPETKELGVAVQSKFVAVGAVVPWAEANRGAVATQAWANTTYGPQGLELLAQQKSPQEVLSLLVGQDPYKAYRQVAFMNAKGETAQYTGALCKAWAGQRSGKNYAVQGNLLQGKAVVEAMAKSFESSEGKDFAERLIEVLRAGQKGGWRSARKAIRFLVDCSSKCWLWWI